MCCDVGSGILDRHHVGRQELKILPVGVEFPRAESHRLHASTLFLQLLQQEVSSLFSLIASGRVILEVAVGKCLTMHIGVITLAGGVIGLKGLRREA